MRAVESNHPSGSVVVVCGETWRYSIAATSLTTLEVPPSSQAQWMIGVLVAKSLNTAFQNVVDDPNMQWAWLTGDDHVYSPQIALRLLEHKKDVVIPLCLNRRKPFRTTVRNHVTMELKRLDELHCEGLYKLSEDETCGDAGMLISRKAILATGPLWYDNRRTGAFGDIPEPADDMIFTAKLKEAGFDIYLDCATYMGHITPIILFPRVVDGKLVASLGSHVQHICDLGEV